MNPTRRHFLWTASALAASSILGCSHRAITTSGPALPATLREAGRRNNLLAGSAVAARPLRNSPAYADLIRSQCSIVVAENAMKFGPLRPGPDDFSFDDADYLVDFGQRNNILVRGHNFVWHRQLPRWFTGFATPANAGRLLTDHIHRVGTRYAGRMHSWDVCNEVIQVDDQQPGGLRNSPWYKLLGAGYIDDAYRAAREADPSALLFYNDYDIESESPAHAAKRAAVLALLRGLLQRGVPLDGLGIQTHLAAGPKHQYGQGLTNFMAEVQSMGLKLCVTEMDVNDRDLPADAALRDREVAAVYSHFLGLALANPAMLGVLTWGLSDRYTWLNGEDSRPDHLPERCLPFDDELKPVPAFMAELAALQQAPARPVPARGRQA